MIGFSPLLSEATKGENVTKSFVSVLMISVGASLLSGCSLIGGASPQTQPTPTERALSADPDLPSSCATPALLSRFPNITFKMEARESGDDVIMDGTPPSSGVGCTSKKVQSLYGVPTKDWPTIFTYTKTFEYGNPNKETKAAWQKRIVEGGPTANYEVNAIEGCDVLTSTYIPAGSEVTQSYAYCNGLEVDFWTPSGWLIAKPILVDVLDAIQ